MHQLLLILLIALLPLRSWAGDAMAMEMAAQSAVTIKIVAENVHLLRASSQFDANERAVLHPDCAGHAQAASGPAAPVPGPDDAVDSAGQGHCNSCDACQICHSLALANTATWLAAAFIAPTPLPVGSIRFTSALPALWLKPPIS